MNSRAAPLRWADYVEQALRSNQLKSSPDAIQSIRFGYFGQVGSLMSAVKKSGRDARSGSVTAFALEEIGDALWYLCALAASTEVSAEALGLACIQELQTRFTTPSHPEWPQPTFRQVDGIIAAQRHSALQERATVLRDLAYQAGVLLHDDDPQRDFRQNPQRDKQLGKLAAGLALAAERFGSTLEFAAYKNLEKIRRRWPGTQRLYHPFFDSDFPRHEQFPRRFTVDYVERGTPERPVVTQSICEVFVGDSLTDNIVESDGYRFHDVFHLAYVAHLGWSPVIRGLLKRKRKSDKSVDENQDGARAAIIEEGIATWIFNHAKAQAFFAHVEEGRLDYELLKQIDQMVKGYEVDQVPLWQWERAILSGMEVFRTLFANRGGSVTVDMESRSLTYLPAAPRS
jgi:hypothetical protein